MVNEILTKWPYLKNEFVSEADAFDLWKYRLRTYFKNPRRRTHNIPEILSRQKKEREMKILLSQLKRAAGYGVCQTIYQYFQKEKMKIL